MNSQDVGSFSCIVPKVVLIKISGENDVAELRKTTKQDILNVLMTYIHTSSPTRAKLSVHLKSQYRGIKFDLASAAPLVKSFTEAGIAVDPIAIQKLLSNNPTLEQVKEFASSTIDAAANVVDDVKAQLKGVVAELKGQEAGPGAEAGAGPGPEDVKVRPGNVWIEDIQEFKARLVPSKAAVPVEPLKTLALEL